MKKKLLLLLNSLSIESENLNPWIAPGKYITEDYVGISESQFREKCIDDKTLLVWQEIQANSVKNFKNQY